VPFCEAEAVWLGRALVDKDRVHGNNEPNWLLLLAAR
jgi:hypothetical protein